MIETAGKILDVAKSLLGMKDAVAKSRREQQDRFVAFLEAIAETTRDVLQSLRDGRLPAGSCSKMQILCRELESMLSYMPSFSMEHREIIYRIQEAYDAGMLLWETERATDVKEKFRKIEEAIGLIEGLAAALKAKPC